MSSAKEDAVAQLSIPRAIASSDKELQNVIRAEGAKKVMNSQLEGKTALVTGSTAGIGLAIATELTKGGVAVIVNGRTQERVDKAIRTSGAAYGIAADLGTEAGARAVSARFPAVDILVNNLGIFESKPFDQILDEDWRRFFEVNVMSGVRLSRHYV